MTAAGIAPRTPRLADLPAAAVLSLVPLLPRSGPAQLAALQIRPGPEDDTALVEAASATSLVRFLVSGSCSRPVAIPRGPLGVLRRRHPHADRLVLDELEVGLGLRTFATDSTLAISCAAAPDLPPLSQLLADLPTAPPEADDDWPLVIDPLLLTRALDVMRQLGAARVELLLMQHPVVGASLLVRPGRGCESVISGQIQLARCRPAEAS